MKKLLIANRGEIAVRIVRTAREMGIRTVVAYSETDRTSIAVAMADEAVCLGPAPAVDSYLNISNVIQAAIASGSDAIHPGYGFLSERAEFARACEEASIKLVGPSSHAMELLGSKISAKALAQGLSVPLVPGYFQVDATDDDLIAAAAKIGYPVMLKASAGGGGRGMRAVFEPTDLPKQLELARDEALKAFGDGAMMIEKLVLKPRHIEAQVLADQHGGVAVLFERECSLQRRRQKVVEESPSPMAGFAETLWPAMEAAVRALVLGAGYSGAGTVEFMVDEAAQAFYFLEVNTRLQVEHPVTEAITGLDLVAWQLRIADGEPLPPAILSPSRLGHAIEVRIIAEDPGAGFMPSVGKILGWAPPAGPGIRVDSGFRAGDEVSRFYDSLLAKLIVFGSDRPAAIAKLRAALLDFHILGVATNLNYLLAVIDHSAFRSGEIDTDFLEREFPDYSPSIDLPEGLGSVAAHPMGALSSGGSEPSKQGAGVGRLWGESDGFRNVKPI